MSDPTPQNKTDESPGCQCELCLISMRARAVCERRDPDQLIGLLQELMNSWVNSMFDLDWAEAVLEGEWESSVEILERKLAAAKVKRAAKAGDA